jgi:CRISPR-associated Csx2 family protein
MKIISFLGFGKYTQTTYVSTDGQTCYTPFFQEALVKFYSPEILYVMLTNKVENELPNGQSETNWSALERILKESKFKGKLEPIRNIPEKNSPDDIWQIFKSVTELLEPGDEVIFDITHSFRSIPIVALISVSYLRIVKEVKIAGLLYGAYEAKNENNETPIFDLLPIVSLLDWTTATDQFIKTGNGESLAKLLTGNGSETDRLANNIQSIAQGLQVLRPMELMKQASVLPENIELATQQISQKVPPFASLLQRVERDYSKFGLANPEDYQSQAKEVLWKELEMIKWYEEKGQIVQALSLAREWLPSLLCFKFALDPMEKKNRDEMENLLNLGGKIKNKETGVTKESEQWLGLPKELTEKLKELCTGDPNKSVNLSNLRNDVLHSGFRKNPKKASEITEKTKKIIAELDYIAENFL